jgi:Sodium:solute symporter family
VFGTAGLPHVLMRFYTVPSSKEARRSVVWAIWIIGIFYLLTLVLGFGAAALVGRDAILAAPGKANSAAPLLAFFFGWLGTVPSREASSEVKFAEVEVRSLTGAGVEKASAHETRLSVALGEPPISASRTSTARRLEPTAGRDPHARTSSPTHRSPCRTALGLPTELSRS